MRLGTLATLLWSTATSVLATACGRETTEPRAIAFTGPSAALVTSPVTVVPLERTNPLAAPQQASAVIGLLGGTLSLPGAGLAVVVPPLAVSSPITISVTALAGTAVAYDFAPHGIRFAAPLIVTQSLQGTQAGEGGTIDPLSLFVGYFLADSSVSSVTELLSVTTNVLNLTSTVSLWHFSGYMWSSGLSGDPGDSTSVASTAAAALASRRAMTAVKTR